MEFNIYVSKNIKLTDSIREKIQVEFEHMRKDAASHVDVSLQLESDGVNHAKIKLNIFHTQLHADGKGATLFTAIHDAVLKLNKQIEKHKK